ncbi:hypothetical protein TNCV_2993601 [Trichonephila clavipes]|nr:hypothetical protein TNCV_2993601 [Trichonephila clavipes]
MDCGTSCVTCCAVFLEQQLLDIMFVQFRNEKVSNHGSILIPIDCNVVAIVFEEGFHQPIKRTKQCSSPYVFKLQETKLPVRRINTTNERRLVLRHETLLRVKEDIEDVSSELVNRGDEKTFELAFHFLLLTSTPRQREDFTNRHTSSILYDGSLVTTGLKLMMKCLQQV